jgi:hypothetical protein
MPPDVHCLSGVQFILGLHVLNREVSRRLAGVRVVPHFHSGSLRYRLILL